MDCCREPRRLQEVVMSLWRILPFILPVFGIPGLFAVYWMALINQHVRPLFNWFYNELCEEQLSLQRGLFQNCTLDNIPFVSKCGTLPPESCLFSLICSISSIMMMLIGWLRYCLVLKMHLYGVLNEFALYTGLISAVGLIVVGSFQVDFAKVPHYIGAITAFLSSMLFLGLQTALTYKLAKTQKEYRIFYLRLVIALLMLIALLLSGVFFFLESLDLQLASAIFEWIYCILIMIFYGTFAFEFGDIPGFAFEFGDIPGITLKILSRGGMLQNFSNSGHNIKMGGGFKD